MSQKERNRKSLRLIEFLAIILMPIMFPGLGWSATKTYYTYQIGVDENCRIISAVPSMNKVRNRLELREKNVKASLAPFVLKGSQNRSWMWPDLIDGLGLVVVDITCETKNGESITNQLTIPFGKNVKIITLDDNGVELLPRPLLDENDEIYFLIVNLKDTDQDVFDLHFNAKDFNANYNRMASQPEAESAKATEKSIPPKPSFKSKIVPLGNFRGEAGISSEGLWVDYEIKKCDAQKKCVPFAGVELKDDKKKDSSSKTSSDNKDKQKNKKEESPEGQEIASDVPVPPPLNNDEGKKEDKKEDKKEKDNQSSDSASSGGTLRSNLTLKIHNLYRFRVVGGFVLSGFEAAELEKGSNLTAVFGLAFNLGPERNLISELPWASLQRVSLWVGMGIPEQEDELLNNFYLGLSYQVYQGVDVTAGYNLRTITEHVDHDPDQPTYNDLQKAWFVGVMFDLDVFTRAFIDVPASLVKQWNTSAGTSDKKNNPAPLADTPSPPN